MAAENMANIVQGYLLKQERPEYLQPMAQDGSFPWKEKRGVEPGTSSSSTGTSTGTTSSSDTTGRRKRAPNNSSPDQQRRGKSSRT